MGQRTLALILISGVACVAAPVKVGWREANGRRSIQSLDVEEYTALALNGEAGVFTAPAALEALAITIRTYARFNLGRHGSEGYDFCDTTHCQRLLRGPAQARVRAAVDATQGIILWARGRPADVYFHRNCGGRTEDAGAVWQGASRTWLPMQVDDACVRLGTREWRARIALGELAQALGSADIHSIRIASRTPSGRVAVLWTDAGQLDAERVHLAVGRELGWNYLKSRLYDVHIEGVEAVFTGRGSGHGVGLCQDGAEARGRAGASAEQILAFYFPGTRAAVNAQGFVWKELRGERVTLRSESPDGQLLSQCERALGMAEERSGLRAAAGVRVVVYPTLDAYRDATGEPAFVLASTRGSSVRTQSIDRLKTRGHLESIILHETLHVILEQNSHNPLPHWFLEGLVVILAGEQTERTAWHSDVERTLVTPRDEAQLRAAYAAAATRVGGLIARYGRRTVLAWVHSGLPPEVERGER